MYGRLHVGRITPPAQVVGQMAEAQEHVEAQSLVPYLNGEPGFTRGWTGHNTDVALSGGYDDFGRDHASYFIWGGRVWLQGCVYWIDGDDGGATPVNPIIGALPAEIRPVAPVTMPLYENWNRSIAGTGGVGGSGNTEARVDPDGTWTITGVLHAQEDGPAYMLEGISWPLPGLVIQNPEADRLDLTPFVTEFGYVPGPDGAFLVSGGGRIRGEGSILAVGATDMVLDGLPFEWLPKTRVPVPAEPPEMVGDGTPDTSQELTPFNGTAFYRNERAVPMRVLAGGSEEPEYETVVNAIPFVDFRWEVQNSPYFGAPTGGYPTVGTLLSLDRVTWIGGDTGGVALTPGAAEAAEALGGAVRNAVRAVGRTF